ncbi:ABC transporter ATP-binding protein [Staphylococcus sp. ACRSN]|uniref:ABC transporter ATP-binding protein n=1 Tax=Staphylococcus sp. ACRSN TaxID=2918214 RepID=UPI001EF33D98|nr:ABC transporter ATP-binding protein [Staphylococcus sp. ACRSN]MCG7338026.1 ABC transporter ATP-binding protein [Staphylococcus sp. ACRSN]
MIDIKNVSFQYEQAKYESQLKEINLKINQGEIVCITGASGSGKTTLIRVLNGIIPNLYHGALSGELSINGKSIFQQSLYDISSKLGSVFQNPRSQFFCLNTTSELVFEAENFGLKKEVIQHNLKKSVSTFEIKHLLNRSILELSGGEKQIIACTSVDITGHSIIILDEPSSNLDITTIKKLQKMLRIWKNEGKTIVIAEHRLHYLLDLADRFIIMEKGRIVDQYQNNAFVSLPQQIIHKLGLRSATVEQLKYKGLKNNSKATMQINKLVFKYKTQKEATLNIEHVKLGFGKITALIGENGAGKSTFARCIAGLESKMKSKIFIDDKQYKQNDLLNMAYLVFQDVNNQLFAENIEEELRLTNPTLSDVHLLQLLKELDISEHIERHPLSLSGGEMQRLAIASALESNRKILIFDEPSSGLDGANMRTLSQLLDKLAQQGHMILLITHDYEFVTSCADEVIVFEHGSVVNQFTTHSHNKNLLFRYFDW